MQFTRYLMVGGITYALDMGGFLLFFNYFGVGPLIANAIAKVLAGLFAFFAHRYFTFGVAKGGGTARQAIRYFSLLALNIPFSALILSIMLWLIPIAVVAKFTADIICVFYTYWLSKHFVFLNPEAASNAASPRVAATGTSRGQNRL
ncbi:GtrA family protein [Paraburkholderia hayleyella]|uniref:GtrA family protein n=1 Tax=Paraburkholderia hayleyella TaxID=2152889 RepID=UPI0012916BD5|nr:GtrA family protein [Paraburkholderia hayleyella]